MVQNAKAVAHNPRDPNAAARWRGANDQVGNRLSTNSNILYLLCVSEKSKMFRMQLYNLGLSGGISPPTPAMGALAHKIASTIDSQCVLCELGCWN